MKVIINELKPCNLTNAKDWQMRTRIEVFAASLVTATNKPIRHLNFRSWCVCALDKASPYNVVCSSNRIIWLDISISVIWLRSMDWLDRTQCACAHDMSNRLICVGLSVRLNYAPTFHFIGIKIKKKLKTKLKKQKQDRYFIMFDHVSNLQTFHVPQCYITLDTDNWQNTEVHVIVVKNRSFVLFSLFYLRNYSLSFVHENRIQHEVKACKKRL